MADETLGELYRRQERHEHRTERELANLEARSVDRASKHVDARVYAVERQALAKDITDVAVDLAAAVADWQTRYSALEARLQWAWRAALTGLLFPIAVGVIVLIFQAIRDSS